MKTVSRIVQAFQTCAGSKLLAMGLGLGVLTAAAQDAKTKAPPPSASGTLSEVFNVKRSRAADLLLLRNGDQLAGTLLNESLRMKTGYAELKFESRKLAGIDFGVDARGLESILTVNSNRFSGFLEDPRFTVLLATGDRIEVRREKILMVVFRQRESELRGIPQGRWFRLQNGDWVSGQLLVDTLAIVTERAKIPARLGDVASLALAPGKTATTQMRLRNGEVLHGTLELEDFPIQLDAGPKIQLYRDRLAGMSDRLEPGTATFSAVKSGNHIETPSAVSPHPNQTNIEGLVWIPAGTFTMGSPTDEAGRDEDEGPQTRVTIPQGFWMGKCEVTQAEFQAVTGTNPSNYRSDPAQPVERVNWHEAMAYCLKLTQKDRAAGRLPEGWAYRLPTEAEWEYACRAGTTTRFSYGDDKGYVQLGDHAWFTGNSSSTTHPVGTKRANPWGLFDMHGNVWEWCLDRWQGFLPGGNITNQPVAAEGSLRVARGGSWLYEGMICRSANRDDYSPSNRCSDLGFRVVLAPSQP